jgi:RHS repeat-associated protein
VTALAVPNGNAIALAGSYRYDPFGRLIGTPTGLAAINTQRYSSKDWHNPSGFYYFGYRFYDPATQRWLNRDPIGEGDGPNLYAYVRNRAINVVDIDGRTGWGFAGPGWELHNNNGQWEYWKPHCQDSPCINAIMEARSMLGNVSNDKRAHCILSCHLAKSCGQRIASALGTMKEARDLAFGGFEWTASWVIPKSWEERLHENLHGGNTDDSADDFYANDYGLDLAKAGMDCVSECEKKFGEEF